MPFNVRVNITGLCLFVPDAVTGKNPNPKVHTLLAKHGTGADEHLQVLVARVTRTNNAVEDLPAITLTNLSLTIGQLGNQSTQRALFGTSGIRLPSRIVDVRDFAGVPDRVPRASLGDKPTAEVAARVTILSGRFAGTSPSARWHAVDEPAEDGDRERGQQMTTAANWRLRVANSSEFVFARLRGAGALPSLAPSSPATIKLFELWVYNATLADLTNQPRDRPKKNDPVKHFEGYFDLLHVPASGRPHPRLVEDPATEFALPSALLASRQESALDPIVRTAETSQCVVAQAEPA